MPRVTVDLPDHLHDFVKDEVAKRKGLVSKSAFVSMLVQGAYDREHQDELEELLLEGVNRGPGTPLTKADWDYIRTEGKRRVALLKKRYADRRQKVGSR
jgi:Arc/MetJ-type ribon-helix-helix transcriptional regulator